MASFVRLCALSLVPFVAGCGPGRAPVETRAASPEAPAPAPAPAPARARAEPGPPTGSTDELPHLEGRSQEQLIAELGAPDRSRTFVMADCCTELTIELLNTHPLPESAAVEIRELTWDYEGYDVTVWLHRPDTEWLVLDTIRHGDDVEF